MAATTLDPTAAGPPTVEPTTTPEPATTSEASTAPEPATTPEPAATLESVDAPRSTRTDVAAGIRAMLPLLGAIVPFAIVVGVAAHRAGIDLRAAWVASFALCAGTAQLTAIELLGSGAAPLTIVATTAVINGRFALYSAGLARWFADEPLGRRLLLAFPLVDQLFVVCQSRFADDDGSPGSRRAFYLGAAATLVVGWSVAQAAAMVFAGSIPDVSLLHLAAPLVFMGMVAGAVQRRGQLVAALVAAIVAVASSRAPQHLNLAIGIAAGVLVGYVVDRRSAS